MIRFIVIDQSFQNFKIIDRPFRNIAAAENKLVKTLTYTSIFLRLCRESPLNHLLNEAVWSTEKRTLRLVVVGRKSSSLGRRKAEKYK
jgi:hypothetical protein